MCDELVRDLPSNVLIVELQEGLVSSSEVATALIKEAQIYKRALPFYLFSQSQTQQDEGLSADYSEDESTVVDSKLESEVNNQLGLLTDPGSIQGTAFWNSSTHPAAPTVLNPALPGALSWATTVMAISFTQATLLTTVTIALESWKPSTLIQLWAGSEQHQQVLVSSRTVTQPPYSFL